jgi:hypothetical protein
MNNRNNMPYLFAGVPVRLKDVAVEIVYSSITLPATEQHGKLVDVALVPLSDKGLHVAKSRGCDRKAQDVMKHVSA